MRVLALFGGVVRLGAERSNIEMITALKDAGAEVLLLVPDGNWAADMRSYLTSLGLRYVECPYLLVAGSNSRFRWVLYPFQIIYASAKFLAVVRQYKPTGVLCSSPLAILNFLPALALSDHPLVYRCDDKPILHSWVFVMIWRFILWRSSTIVAVSRFIARVAITAGAMAERVSVIYNRPPRRAAHETFKESTVEADAFYVIFAGQVTEKKGVAVLVEAFRKVHADYPASRLLIVGRISDWVGDTWAREFRDATLKDESLCGHVIFSGFMDDVPGLMERCDLNVTPTLTEEPLGNVVMEAKLAGIPSVVFPSGGLPEMIRQGENGFICETRDVEGLAAGLRFYLSQPDLAKTHGEAARQSLDRLIGNFTQESIAAFEAARVLQR
jgi:glycosyltransferase involved in cell wall biosynthesis